MVVAAIAMPSTSASAQGSSAPIALSAALPTIPLNTQVTISSIDIVGFVAVEGDQPLAASGLSFDEASVDGVPSTLAAVGFSYLPGPDRSGSLVIDTNAAAFTGLAAPVDVAIAFTARDAGGSEATSRIGYKVDTATGLVPSVSIDYAGVDVRFAGVCATQTSPGATIKLTGPSGVAAALAGVDLSDGSHVGMTDAASGVEVAVAVSVDGSIANSRALDSSSAYSFVDQNSAATATAVDGSTSVAMASGSSAAMASTSFSSDAEATAAMRSVATAQAAHESDASATATSDASATSIADSSSKASSTAAVDSAASAISVEVSEASATASDTSDALAYADSITLANATAVSSSSATARAVDDNGIAEVEATEPSTTAIASTDGFATGQVRPSRVPGLLIVDSLGSDIILAYPTGQLGLGGDAADLPISFAGPGLFELAPLPAGSTLSTGSPGADGFSVIPPQESTVTITPPAGSTATVGFATRAADDSFDGTVETAVVGGGTASTGPVADYFASRKATIVDQATAAAQNAERPEVPDDTACDGPRQAPPLSQLPQCEGQTVTIFAVAGTPTVGTSGDDVILGTAGDDEIDAGGGDDLVCALQGNDIVVGGGGNDTLFGGEGRDIMRGNAGVDRLEGQGGNDRLLGGIDGDTLIGGEGNDYLGGFGGADTINGGPGNETIFGGFGADVIDAGPGDDKVFGLVGNDTINGGPGDDELNGDRGNDVINGGDGDDVIKGGNANDVLNGGDGDDSVNGGRADDQLSGGGGANDTCVGNKEINGDTADGTCETIFGVP